MIQSIKTAFQVGSHPMRISCYRPSMLFHMGFQVNHRHVWCTCYADNCPFQDAGRLVIFLFFFKVYHIATNGLGRLVVWGVWWFGLLLLINSKHEHTQRIPTDDGRPDRWLLFAKV